MSVVTGMLQVLFVLLRLFAVLLLFFLQQDGMTSHISHNTYACTHTHTCTIFFLFVGAGLWVRKKKEPL